VLMEHRLPACVGVENRAEWQRFPFEAQNDPKPPLSSRHSTLGIFNEHGSPCVATDKVAGDGSLMRVHQKINGETRKEQEEEHRSNEGGCWKPFPFSFSRPIGTWNHRGDVGLFSERGKSDRFFHSGTHRGARERLLDNIKDPKVLRSQTDDAWIITRNQYNGRIASFGPDSLGDVQSGTIRQLIIQNVDVERFSFDSAESIRHRLADLNLIVFVGKHPVNDSTDGDVVVNN
jgi:hypothetical protein